MNNQSNKAEMSQEFAQRLFSEGAALVLLHVPPGTEIGIDLKSWNAGEKFKGIKMIPPGLHFVYYSAVSKQGQTAPRTGFFHHFQPQEVLVKVYQPDTEEFISENADQVERIKLNLRSLDGNLGPYPVDLWRQWVSLSQYISWNRVKDVMPHTGLVCSVPAMVPVADPNCSSTANSDARKRQKTHQQEPLGSHCTDNCGTGSANIPQKPPPDVDMKDASHSGTNDTEKCNKKLSDEAESPSDTSLKRNLQDVVLEEDCSRANGSTGTEEWVKITDDDVSSSSAAKVHQNSCPSNSNDPGLPELAPIPGTEFRWLQLPKRPFRQGASPAEVTAAGMDSSYLLEWLMENSESGGDKGDVVSELQLSFLVFLVGQSLVGWERWKQLIDLLCRAERALVKHPDMFCRAMAALHYQIQEVSEDLFVDIVEHQNFLAASLATLFANISDNSHELPSSLVDRANKFRRHLTTRFAWSFDLEGNEEDAPVVVEL